MTTGQNVECPSSSFLLTVPIESFLRFVDLKQLRYASVFVAIDSPNILPFGNQDTQTLIGFDV